MLIVPVSIFQYNKKTDTIFAPYVTERLDDDTIKDQVCANLKDKKIEGELANTYIEYCKKNKIKEACELSESVISDTEYCE